MKYIKTKAKLFYPLLLLVFYILVRPQFRELAQLVSNQVGQALSYFWTLLFLEAGYLMLVFSLVIQSTHGFSVGEEETIPSRYLRNYILQLCHLLAGLFSQWVHQRTSSYLSLFSGDLGSLRIFHPFYPSGHHPTDDRGIDLSRSARPSLF